MSDVEEEVVEETLSFEQRVEQIMEKNKNEMMETIRVAREASDKRIEENMQLFVEFMREFKEMRKDIKKI